jgi:hypothetical protein
MLEPQTVGVDTTEDDRGDNDAVLRKFLVRTAFVTLHLFDRRGLRRLSLGKRTMGGWGIGKCILDGELAPEICGKRCQRSSKANRYALSSVQVVTYHWWQQRGP